mmetsp:Transcript_65382/g.108637  ORF Transcript_65382/g.108637 Transcript_65382/m.108637 type:complete len:376 (-) Transcript_65382:27-1154(-)
MRQHSKNGSCRCPPLRGGPTQVNCCKIILLALSAARGQIIGGYGEYRYQYIPELLQLPRGAEVQHAHGLAVDPSGNIYLTYVNWNNGIQTNGTDEHCLVRWAPDATNGTFMDLGGSALCKGTPHGLKVANENGSIYLYHANCATKPPRYGSGKITKSTLDGKILWQHEGFFGQDPRSLYRPTWWAIPPTGPYIYLADGYGSSNIYLFTRDGVFQNRTYGGKGHQEGKFNNCHGITHDPRSHQLVVSDRENHRLQYFDIDSTGTKFEHASTVTPTWGEPGTQRPCNVRVLQSANPSLDGMAIIADLGADDQSKPAVGARGQVALVGKQNELLSVIAISDLIGHLGSIHPHDAHLLPNGDVVVATWRPGHVSYWRKL